MKVGPKKRSTFKVFKLTIIRCVLLILFLLFLNFGEIPFRLLFVFCGIFFVIFLSHIARYVPSKANKNLLT